MKTRFMIIMALIAIGGIGRALTRSGHWEGVCVHPFVNGGQPFNFAPDIKIKGSNLVRRNEEGIDVMLIGAQCAIGHVYE